MKRVFSAIFCIIYFLKYDYSYSQQDTIKGKIYSSISLKRPKGEIFINEKGNLNKIKADSTGYFILLPAEKKAIYFLEIQVDNYNKLEYNYKAELIKCKKPKSIVVVGNCKIDSKKAHRNLINNEGKIFIFNDNSPFKNVRTERGFEKKYNVKIIFLDKDDEIYECLAEYNRIILYELTKKYGDKIKILLKNKFVGHDEPSSIGKPCIN